MGTVWLAKYKYYLLAIVVIAAALGGYGLWATRRSSAVTTAKPPASVVISEENGGFVITNNLRIIGRIKKNADLDHLRLLRQVGSSIFIAAYPPINPESYTLFDTPAPRAVLVDILNSHPTVIQHAGRLVGDVSPDGRQIAWLEYGDKERRIIVQGKDSNQEQTFTVPPEFNQFGDVLFSPDGAQIAYAAAVGFPSRERGAALEIDLQSGQTKQIGASKGDNSYVRIKGWKSNNEVELVEVKK